jgi:hypothetical protein
MLRLMDKDVARERDDDDKSGRRGVRNQLRYETRRKNPDGKPGHHPLEVERDAVLRRRLRAVASEPHALQILIDLVCFQPWQTDALDKRRRGDLDGRLRGEVIDWVRANLPGDLPERSRVERLVHGDPRLRMLKIAGLGLGAAAAGIATAGVAAPAVGGAIGGAMGLSGAAALNAGLAFLGGGSLAAGGFGMAGGTTVLAALGATGGGGLGTLAAAQVDRRNKAQFALETRKLRALIRLNSESASSTARAAAVEQQLVIEADLARLLSQRVNAAMGRELIAGEVEDEIREVTRLRGVVGVEGFPVEPC